MGLETAAIVGIIGTIASIGTSIYAQSQAADSQQAQSDYQAAVARNNATIAEGNAKQREEEARVSQDRAAGDAAIQQQKTRRLISSQVAAASGSGLTTTEGTPLGILSQTAQYGEMDAGRIRANGQDAANGLISEANNLRAQGSGMKAQAGLYTMQGQQAQTAGTMSMIGTGISGATKIYGAYKNR